jgi:hypothetical protein
MSWSLRRLAALCLILALPAAAEPPPGRDSADAARESFERFAKEFIVKLQRANAALRRQPEIRASRSGPLATYRTTGDAFSIELKSTGNAAAPWVGLLRYTEQLYTCAASDPKSCTLAAHTPITEVFRFRKGRWEF